MLQDLGLVFLIIVFFCSFVLTFLYRNWAIKRSILDIPNERSSHITPTPRGGGIAVVITFYLGLFFLFFTGKIEKILFLSLLPGIVIALIGFIDDYSNLNLFIRFATQIICSVIALYFLGGFQSLFNDDFAWLWFLVAIVGFVWFINLFNFLDGSDGYASMEAISIALALWVFTNINVLLLLALSVGGFLYWNWPKAKIFMGDSGSTTLGFILVVFGIYVHNIDKLNFIYWILITALFWFDATTTLFRRIINKEKLSKAHKKHIYQRAIQGGFSHKKTMLIGLGINIILVLICYTIWKKNYPVLFGLFLILFILWLVMKYVDRKCEYKKNE